jgi:hypothetical protein
MTHTFQLIPPPGVFREWPADKDFLVTVHYSIGCLTGEYYLKGVELSPMALLLLNNPMDLYGAANEALRNHHDSNSPTAYEQFQLERYGNVLPVTPDGDGMDDETGQA